MKRYLTLAASGLATALMYIMVVVDRIVLSFLVKRDLPGWDEINEFEHEKDDLSYRTGFYIVCVIIGIIIYHFGSIIDFFILFFG